MKIRGKKSPVKKKQIFQLAIEVLTPVTHIYLRPWFWGPVITPLPFTTGFSWPMCFLCPNSRPVFRKPEVQVLGTNSEHITRWSHGAHVLREGFGWRMDGIPGRTGRIRCLGFISPLRMGLWDPFQMAY